VNRKEVDLFIQTIQAFIQ